MPFRWAAPRYTPKGTDLGSILQYFISKNTDPEIPLGWIISDFGPSRRGLSSVDLVTMRKMSLGRFHFFSTEMWAQPPLSLARKEGRQITSYSARRNLPTLAHGAKFSIDERTYVGGWLDAEAVVAKAKAAMPDRYSDMKLSAALALKVELLTSVRIALAKMTNISSQTSWEEVIHKFPTREQAQFAMGDKSIVTNIPPLPKKDDGSDQSSSEATSPSSSDGEEGADASEDILWLKSTGRRGHLHLRDPSDPACQRTLCGRTLRGATMGDGAEGAVFTEAPWSPRCLGILSPAQRRLVLPLSLHPLAGDI